MDTTRLATTRRASTQRPIGHATAQVSAELHQTAQSILEGGAKP